MKKIIALTICVLILAGLTVTASATTSATMTVTASKTTALLGDEIVFTVSISEVENLRSAGFALNYDTSVFTVVESSLKCTVSNAQSPSFAYNSAAKAYVAYFMLGEAQTYSGSIFQFTLKVNNSAALNTSSTVSLDRVTVRDSSGDISSTQKGVTVTVACSHSFGPWTKVDDTNHQHTCSSCVKKETAAHTWNSGTVTKSATCTTDGVKTYTCTGCGATKTETIKATGHSYSTKWSSDGTKHWHECTVCGAKKDEAAHTPGAAATEWTAQKCTVCGYVIKAALGHTHNYATAWTVDANGHWHACSGCDDEKDYADHVYDNDCDPDCNVCGYTRPVTHTYMDRWFYDETGHWHECTICGAVLEKVPHVTDSQDDEQRCKECGYLVAEEHTHNFEGEWFHDETGHWQECECGQLSPVREHIWDSGTKDAATGITTYTCTVCGAVKTVEAGSEDDPTAPAGDSTGSTAGAPGDQPSDQNGFPIIRWILIGVVVVVAVAFGAYLTVGIIIGKKQKGRFTRN